MSQWGQGTPVGNLGFATNAPGANPYRDLMGMPGIKDITQATQSIKGPPGQFQPPAAAPPAGIDTGFVGPLDQGQRLAFLQAFSSPGGTF